MSRLCLRAGEGIIKTMDSSECILAMTTITDEAQAQRLARQLVESRLAACVNRIRVDSTYRWEGELAQEPEVLLLIKSTRAREEALRAAVLDAHPYELPEFVCLPITGGSEPYLRWLRDSV